MVDLQSFLQLLHSSSAATSGSTSTAIELTVSVADFHISALQLIG
jgi:hypothetical protein